MRRTQRKTLPKFRAGPARAIESCGVPGCTERHVARLRCVRHYAWARYHGLLDQDPDLDVAARRTSRNAAARREP